MDRLHTTPTDRPANGTRPSGEADGRAGREGGFALVTVLLVLTLLSGLTVIAHLTSRAEVQIGGNDYTATRAFYGAESGAETMLADIRSKMADGVLTSAEVNQVDDHPPDLPGYELTTYSAQMTGATQVVEITQGPFSGLKSLSQKLVLTSEVEGRSGAKTRVEMNADALAIPIFQFAAFYNEDLEIFPGADMDLTGRVHTNEDLYLGNDGPSLDLWDIVTASGDLHLHRKHDPTEDAYTSGIDIQRNDGSWEPVNRDAHNWCSSTDPDPACSDDDDDDFVDYSKSNWDNNIQTRAHGIEPLRLPVPSGTDPYEIVAPCDGSSVAAMEDIKFACNADVVLEVEDDDLDIFDSGLGWDVGTEAWFSVNRFYDDREQDDDDDGGGTWAEANRRSNRDVIELDLDEVESHEYDTSSSGEGTIVYVTASPDGGTPLWKQQYVLRVRGGDELHHPLTIATNLPMYVVGDFNDEEGGADWQPASLVSDNVTFLSRCWDDSDYEDEDDGEDNPENACPTKVQAAIMSGHTPTTVPAAPSAAEGGQFENFPRFLEDWGGVDMEIVGSFVSMWYDRFSDEPWQWCGCMSPSEDYYSPPDRVWGFDDRFKDPSKLPPGTPVVGQILRIGFIRTY